MLHAHPWCLTIKLLRGPCGPCGPCEKCFAPPTLVETLLVKLKGLSHFIGIIFPSCSLPLIVQLSAFHIAWFRISQPTTDLDRPFVSTTKMRLIVRDTAQDASAYVAEYIIRRIQEFDPTPEKPFVLGLPTGSSPETIYKILVREHKAGIISFKNVITFNMVCSAT